MKTFTIEIEWYNADKVLPEESGNYWCVTSKRFGYVTDLPYSKRHKLFNVYDGGDTKNAIAVTYWAYIPNAFLDREQE